ncbi:unnamed protein product, partial [Ixodes hexagonus]
QRLGHPEGLNYTNSLIGSPRLLLWTPFFDKWYFGLDKSRERDVLLRNCSRKCYVTNDRSLLNYSDAVVFHVLDWNVKDVPLLRSPAQRWVWWIMESPHNTWFGDYHTMKSTFNWTMSYRRDSDVLVPYGRFVERNDSTAKGHNVTYWKSKNTTAMWLVSNCVTRGGREAYIEELRKHIQVDIYGYCGDYKCPVEQSTSCYEAFEKQYFFILAFENSICRDYVTEKFFRALGYDLIPVVFGGANYSQLAPSGSYIDALSFGTPRDLAGYLRIVENNATLYAGFFEWKRRFRAESFQPPDICPLCIKLHGDDLGRTSTYDMWSWWQSESRCWGWMPQSDLNK